MRQKYGTEKRPAEAVITDIRRGHPEAVWRGGEDPHRAGGTRSEYRYRWLLAPANTDVSNPERILPAVFAK